MTDPTITRPTPVPHRLASTLLGLVPALVFPTAAAALVLSWRDDLPARVAVHFGVGGEPDRFTTLTRSILEILLITGAIAVLCWVVAVLVGRDAMTRRLGVGLAAGTSFLGAALLVGMTWIQRGLTDPAQIDGVNGVLLLAVGGALAIGLLCAWASPGDAPAPAPVGTRLAGTAISLGADERAVWTTRVVSRFALIAAGTVAVLVSIGAALSGLPALHLIAAVVLFALLAGGVFDVTIDAAGVTVRSAIGWPRKHIPLDEVTSARVVTVNPAYYGGYGYRVGPSGRAGVITRRGPGLEVERTGNRRFVVTIDDPETAAAVLTALANRHHLQHHRAV